MAAEDELTVFVIGAMAGKAAPSPALVVSLAEAFPRARALELTLALAQAAEGLEAMVQGGRRQADGLYRLATLVAVDTLVLEVEGHAQTGPIRARHLLRKWRDDPFFGQAS